MLVVGDDDDDDDADDGSSSIQDVVRKSWPRHRFNNRLASLGRVN